MTEFWAGFLLGWSAANVVAMIAIYRMWMRDEIGWKESE